jgi:hypothetical protein
MNKKRFAAVLERIEANPSQWDQEFWCGTTCCLAGHTLWLFGTAEERAFASVRRENDEAQTFDVPGRAAKHLDLNPDEEEWLFDAERTLPQFRDFLSEGGLPEDAE